MDITGRQLALRAGFDDEVLEAEFRVQFGAKAGAGEDGERFGGTESLHTGEMTAQDDMLLLSAVLPEEAPEGAEPEWIWSFDGAALRTLYASGVDTLVLCAGESAALIPTEGFAAGTEYTKLKIGGVGSRYFLYEAAMKGTGEEKRAPDMLNLTEDMDFELRVAVQGQEYVLAPYAGEEMYCDGVRVIPLEWLDMTEDEYPAPEALN